MFDMQCCTALALALLFARLMMTTATSDDAEDYHYTIVAEKEESKNTHKTDRWTKEIFFDRCSARVRYSRKESCCLTNSIITVIIKLDGLYMLCLPIPMPMPIYQQYFINWYAYLVSFNLLLTRITDALKIYLCNLKQQCVCSGLHTHTTFAQAWTDTQSKKCFIFKWDRIERTQGNEEINLLLAHHHMQFHRYWISSFKLNKSRQWMDWFILSVCEEVCTF